MFQTFQKSVYENLFEMFQTFDVMSTLGLPKISMIPSLTLLTMTSLNITQNTIDTGYVYSMIRTPNI